MRKALGVVIGCTLLCGLVMAAMQAVPSPANIPIVINGEPLTEGVDQPWFELSVGAKETVQWTNSTGVPCTVLFGGKTPFEDAAGNEVHAIPLQPGQQSQKFTPTKAPTAPPTAKVPKNGVYKVYSYTVICGGVIYDPGGGMRP